MDFLALFLTYQDLSQQSFCTGTMVIMTFLSGKGNKQSYEDAWIYQNLNMSLLDFGTI